MMPPSGVSSKADEEELKVSGTNLAAHADKLLPSLKQKSVSHPLVLTSGLQNTNEKVKIPEDDSSKPAIVPGEDGASDLSKT